MPPGCSIQIIEVIKKMESQDGVERAKKLHENSLYFRQGMIAIDHLMFL